MPAWHFPLLGLCIKQHTTTALDSLVLCVIVLTGLTFVAKYSLK